MRGWSFCQGLFTGTGALSLWIVIVEVIDLVTWSTALKRFIGPTGDLVFFSVAFLVSLAFVALATRRIRALDQAGEPELTETAESAAA